MTDPEDLLRTGDERKPERDRLDHLIDQFIAVGAQAKRLQLRRSDVDREQLHSLRQVARSVFHQILLEADTVGAVDDRPHLLAAALVIASEAAENLLHSNISAAILLAGPNVSAGEDLKGMTSYFPDASDGCPIPSD